MTRVVFFDFVTEFAGKPRCTLELMHALRDDVDFVVLDAYGTCAEYLDTVRAQGYECRVMLEGARSVKVGHRESLLMRPIAVLRAIPELIRLRNALAAELRGGSVSGVWTSSLKGALVARRALRRAGARVPVWLHFRRTWNDRMSSGWRWEVLKDPSVVLIAESQTNAQSLIDHGIPASRVRVIPNAVDFDRVRRAADLGLQDGLPLVEGMPNCLLNGTLYRRKGHLTAIRAVARLAEQGADVGLLLPGTEAAAESRAYYDEVTASIRAHGLEDRVRVIGWRTDMPAVIAATDLTILPSSDEGFPLGLVEAMSLRRPAISTPVGGIPDLLTPGQTGWLHGVDDDRGLADCIRQAIDPAVAAPIVERAYAYVLENHSHESQREAGLRVFKDAS